jgi:tripartite-type tricarboxylate transporter receptor subunit TctC
MNKLGAVLAAGAALSAWIGGAAAQDYPSKGNITYIVPFPAGGGSDTLVRNLSDSFAQNLGQTVIIDNKPGAGGAIGTDVVVRSRPDGYTIGYCAISTLIIAPLTNKNLTYEPMRDLVPVHGMGMTPNLIIVNPDRPYKTLPELIEFAKKNPGEVKYGSAGAGTSTHLAAELLQSVAGVKFTHIPYKGTGQTMADVMSGQIDMIFDYAATSKANIDAGKLRALAVMAENRLPNVPDIVTTAEAGFPKALLAPFDGICVPKGTPEDVIAKISDAFGKTLKDPKVADKFVQMGNFTLPDQDYRTFPELLKTEGARWTELVKSVGMEAK